MNNLFKFFRRFWYVWGLLALLIIWLAAPGAFDLKMSIHDPDYKVGMCFVDDGTCVIACGTNSFGTYSCVTDRKSLCVKDSDCDGYSKLVDAQAWGDAGYANVLKTYDSAVKGSDIKGVVSSVPAEDSVKEIVHSKDKTLIAIVGAVICKEDGKIYDSFGVWDECGGEGCTYEKGVAVCKGGGLSFLNKEFYKVPVFIYLIALLFILLILGVKK